MPAAERDDINLNGARNVGDAAVANKVRRFVYSSSYAAYDQYLLRGQANVTHRELENIGIHELNDRGTRSSTKTRGMSTKVTCVAGS